MLSEVQNNKIFNKQTAVVRDKRDREESKAPQQPIWIIQSRFLQKDMCLLAIVASVFFVHIFKNHRRIATVASIVQLCSG